MKEKLKIVIKLVDNDLELNIHDELLHNLDYILEKCKHHDIIIGIEDITDFITDKCSFDFFVKINIESTNILLSFINNLLYKVRVQSDSTDEIQNILSIYDTNNTNIMENKIDMLNMLLNENKITNRLGDYKELFGYFKENKDKKQYVYVLDTDDRRDMVPIVTCRSCFNKQSETDKFWYQEKQDADIIDDIDIDNMREILQETLDTYNGLSTDSE